jgi:predicted ATPase/DNA-binding CsgD family transcriptional regulator
MASLPPGKAHSVWPMTPLPVPGSRLPLAPLPVPLSSLVGREREVAKVRALLAMDEARLVTLVGPGGVGKTRLALRVAEEADSAFRDGVVFVGLGQISDAEQVLPTIAKALEVREAAGERLDDLLATALLGRRLLLVLDNLEQVLDAARLLAELLLVCPALKILATSRELLHVSGEHGFPVPPLSLVETHASPSSPAAGGPGATVDLTASDAVRLFVTRAQAVQPEFALDGENAEVVAEICRRVDCLPLGIELAAARLRHLSLGSLLSHLDHRLPVLTGGPRDQPARLRTMYDAIAWSYDLLTPVEQAQFRRLAVFVGGFTLDAASVVTDRPSMLNENGPEAQGEHRRFTPGSVLDHIASLVDKSLLRVRQSTDGRTRYGMLETVREFGLAQLAVSGEESATRHRHAAWCLELAEHAGSHAAGENQITWLDHLEDEHANLNSALAWVLGVGQAANAVLLVAALIPFWEERGHLAEGRRWLEQAAALTGDVPAEARLSVLSGAGTMAWLQGDLAAAIRWHEQSLALSREIGDRAGEAFALNNLGVQAMESGNYQAANASCEASLALARAEGEPRLELLALHNLGHIAWLRGEPGRAAARLDETLALARELGEVGLVASGLSALAHAMFDLDDYGRSVAYFRESLEIGRLRGNMANVIDAVEGLARLGTATGSTKSAARLFGATANLREATGMPHSAAEIGYVQPSLTALRKAMGVQGLSGAMAAGRLLSPDEVVAEALALAAAATSTLASGRSGFAASHGLTPREIEVLRLLAGGDSNREISERLFISPATVARHVANIFAKLEVDSRTKAVASAHRHGIT